MNKTQNRAAVIGATGYTGQELIGLLRRHPAIEVAHATSESQAGTPVPGLALRYETAASVPLDEVDVVFLCLPTGESAVWAQRAHDAGARVIDLSADLRDGRQGAVYGLPELWRDEVRRARVVANPGCYPTGVLLALSPLQRAGVLAPDRAVIVNAASGVTGAGRSARRDLLFGEVAEDYRAYGVGNRHRHVPEIARGLARTNGGRGVQFVFTPHLLPIRRGILETIYIPVQQGTDRDAVLDAWTSAYAEEPFVDVWASGLPTIRDVVQSNRVALGVESVDGIDEPMLLVVAAFDNLVKGAAGQAVQNANLMLGLSEAEGLSR